MASAVAPTQARYDNISMWHNFTAWTAQQFRYTVNMTRYAPSLEDLVRAGPRMVMKLGSFIAFHDPVDGFGVRVTADPTASDLFHSTASRGTTTTAAHTTGAGAASAGGAASGGADQDPNAFVSRFSMEGAKGLGSVFSYATSKWALCCVGMAVLLNRTHIFAATRRRLTLRWPIRLLLRGAPVILFAIQARRLLQSMQCQTSPDFALLRWGDANRSSDFMFTQAGGALHTLSSALLLGADDAASCRAVHMIPPVPGDTAGDADIRGSLSRLWPLFETFCLSVFIETVSCAVQGRPVAAETGMTLFEHSLAFAEADAAISNQLGWGVFSPSSPSPAGTPASSVSGNSIAISRSMILRRVNTPPEVLLVAFLSAMSHLTSHILGILNLQSRFRLVSTGFWGLCFMGSIIWSALTFSFDDPSSQGLLRFPTVCIIGFIPHVLVLAGICVCFVIYGLALTLSALSPPDADGPRLGFRERFARAHGNMQANISLSDIRITMEMDFYTALLRTGFGAITMASEAVYLSEDRQVNLKRYTWLEDERFREMEELRMQWLGVGVPGSRYDSIGAIGLVPVKEGQQGATSGFARERAAQKISKTRTGDRRVRQGIGAAERSGRWLMAVEFIMNINKLIMKAAAMVLIKSLAAFGVRIPPRWLRWILQPPKLSSKDDKRERSQESSHKNAERRVDLGDNMLIPMNDDVDVEEYMRQQLLRQQGSAGPVDEKELDNTLYNWWLSGGFWGSKDDSGDFQPETGEDDDFDATSVISTSVSGVESEWESDYQGSEGQRTPTQSNPRGSRESTPLMDTPMAMSDLARLLQPSSPEEREEARVLAAHLGSERPMTRSQYQKYHQRQKAQLLLSSRTGLAQQRAGSGRAKLSPEDEALLLEQILLSRRDAVSSGSSGESSSSARPVPWSSGAAGLGPDGPQCVVCQSAPRTIIVWPCRCLSLCDDCRVALAMNNFDKCVCCRREVVSFSRIYVP